MYMVEPSSSLKKYTPGASGRPASWRCSSSEGRYGLIVDPGTGRGEAFAGHHFCQRLHKVFYADDLHVVDRGRQRQVAGRHQRPPEAQSGRFLQPALERDHRAHLAGQADLACQDEPGIDRTIQIRGGDGDADAQVAGRIAEIETADHVDVDVMAGQGKPDLAL